MKSPKEQEEQRSVVIEKANAEDVYQFVRNTPGADVPAWPRAVLERGGSVFVDFLIEKGELNLWKISLCQ